jgi:eukaryotic-like serine/threonine-protein kinase
MVPWNGLGLRWWTLLGAVSFLLYFSLLVYCEVRRPEALGLAIDFDGAVVAKVAAGSPADRGGLRPGDVLVAVDGRPIRSPLAWRVVESGLIVGNPLRITVDRAGTRADVDLTIRWLESSRRGLGDRLTLWVARGVQGVTLLLALLVAMKRPDEPLARVGAALLAGIGVFTVLLPPRFAAVWYSLPVAFSALLWIPFVSWISVGPLWFVFSTLFPRVTRFPRGLWVAIAAPFTLVGGWHLWHGILMVYAPARATSVPDWSIAVVLTGVTYAVAGVALLVAKYRRLVDPNERRRVRILMFGSITGLAAGLPVVLGRWLGVITSDSDSLAASPGPAVGMLLLLSFPVAFAYATVRHRMFDVAVIIRQGLRYTLARRLLLSLVPVLVVVIIVDALLQHDQTVEAVIRAHGPFYGSLAVIIAVASVRRDAWLEGLDRRFFRERYNAQHVLRQLVDEIRRHAGDFVLVAPTVVTQLEATLHPRFAQILLRDPGAPVYRVVAAVPPDRAPEPPRPDSKVMGVLRVLARPIEVFHADTGWLRHHLPAEERESLRHSGVDLLVPIRPSSSDTEAVLVLGEKRSEEPYSAEDHDLLSAIANGLALLLERQARRGAIDAPTLEECPDCGACYDSGSDVCARDGSRLTPVPVPRKLAGRYRLSRRLGQGGMGAVYAAFDLSLGREVAAKLIREDVMERPGVAERFHVEARLAAGFSHPNVVTVHDFGLTRGRAFLIMELVDGITLREELQTQGRIPPRRVCHLLSGMCAAVEEAHHHRLVHRDLKPENVMLTGRAREVAKILDFGVAKLLQTDTTVSGHDTAGDVRVGTLRYMAPEQLRGENVQPAWDLWALGVLAFEMLTDSLPFSVPIGLTVPYETQWTVDVSRRATLRGVSGDWQEFFAHALALDPARRPQSASAFLNEFERAVG